MGYYVHITSSTARIPFNQVFDACNKIEAWSGDGTIAGQVLTDLGFETEVEPNSDLWIVGFDAKSRDEQNLLETIAPFLEGEMEWRGEEGEQWKNVFLLGEKMQYQSAMIVWQ